MHVGGPLYKWLLAFSKKVALSVCVDDRNVDGESNSNNHNNNNHNYATNGGPNANTAALHENENYIEDYMSLSYLKDFINHISNKPSMYDQGINELTLILNSYLDEDDCVLELIVNQIVDQVINLFYICVL